MLSVRSPAHVKTEYPFKVEGAAVADQVLAVIRVQIAWSGLGRNVVLLFRPKDAGLNFSAHEMAVKGRQKKKGKRKSSDDYGDGVDEVPFGSGDDLDKEENNGGYGSGDEKKRQKKGKKKGKKSKKGKKGSNRERGRNRGSTTESGSHSMNASSSSRQVATSASGTTSVSSASSSSSSSSSTSS